MAKLIIRVPATSANLGSGIDSVGLALQLYYTVIVEEKTDEWKVNHALGNDIPTDENNLIVQAILKVNAEIHPHQLTVISDVPIAHGLGSSTTAVVAGRSAPPFQCRQRQKPPSEMTLRTRAPQLGKSRRG